MRINGVRWSLSTIRRIMFAVAVTMTVFMTGKLPYVNAAANSNETTYSYDISGWEIETHFNPVTGTLAPNSTGGFTIVRQASGSSKGTKSSSSGTSGDSILKIPDYIEVTVTYNATGTDGKSAKQTKTIRKPVTELADNVFYQNDTLAEVVIPSTLKKVGNYAFYNCRNLKKIIVPSSVEELGEGAFEYCTSLESITIPSTLSEIKRHAFFQCSALSDLKFMLPSTVKTIGPSAFSGCTSLKTVTIPASVEDINEDAFENCSNLTDIIILTSDSLNNSVTIGRGAFEGCTELKVFNVPSSVTNIGSHAFWNCTSLNEVYFPDSYNQALLSADVFEGCPGTLKLISGKTSNVITYAVNHGIRFKYRTGNLVSVAIDNTEMTWSGNARKPAIVGVYDVDGQLVNSSDYTVAYTDCKKVGYAAVTVTAKDAGCYLGSAVAYYTIKPRATKFTQKKTANRAITLKWKKRSEADGYYIQYSRYADFRDSSVTTRTKTVKNYKTITKTIPSLKKGKKYYIRVRSYKKVGSDKICSDWSKTVTVKVK